MKACTAEARIKSAALPNSSMVDFFVSAPAAWVHLVNTVCAIFFSFGVKITGLFLVKSSRTRLGSGTSAGLVCFTLRAYGTVGAC